MSKSEIELEIIDYDMEGRGVAKRDGNIYFIENAMVGEKVVAEIVLGKNNLFFGLAKFVSNKQNTNRILPLCEYYKVCGGCSLMHANYSEQLRIKTNSVKNTISKTLGANIKVQPCKPSYKQLGYRNKIELRVEGCCFGLCENNSHKIVPINDCLLCDKWFAKFEKIAKVALKNNQNIVEIVLRYLNDNLCVVLVTESKRQLNSDVWVRLLKNEFDSFSIYQNVRKKNSKSTLGEDYLLLYGDLTQKLKTCGFVLSVSPNSFLQINECVQDEIYQYVLNELSENKTVINAYSGAGFLTAILSQKSKYVYGVEIDCFAHNDAEKLMQQNKIKNVKNICGDCSMVLPKLVGQIDKNFCVVVDPARSGLTKNVCDAIKSSKPEKIIYISCNPSTLARDLKTFVGEYQIKQIQPFDMFPQTKHVETVVVLEKVYKTSDWL